MNIKKLDILYNYELQKEFKTKQKKAIINYQKFMDNFILEHQYQTKEENYQLLELLIFEIYDFKLWINDQDKKVLLNNILNKITPYLNNKNIFKRFLNLIQTVFEKDNTSLYIKENEQILKFLYLNIKEKWQTNLTINKMQNILKTNHIEELIIFTLKIIEKNINKQTAINLAYNYLDYPKVCDYLLHIYKNNPEKTKELLSKVIIKDCSR